MSKLFLIPALLCFTVSAFASDYPYLAIRQMDGSESLVSSEGLRINISDGKFIVNAVEGKSEFPLSILTSLAFKQGAEDPSGMGTLFCSDASFLDLYDATGLHIGRFSSPEAIMEKMDKGSVYIVKNEKGTVKKFIRK